MKKILLNVAVKILQIIYLPFKLLKAKDKIVYISRQSNSENIDFKLIRMHIEKTNPNIKNVVLTKKIEDGILNKLLYIIEILKQMYHLATSKIVILDTYCITACVLKHKKNTKIIQIWHAMSAVKKFGYQSLNTKSGSSEDIAKIMCMHKNYDYVLAPSKLTAENYIKAFNITEKQIKYLGMPRMDYLLKEDKEIKDKIYNSYPNLKEKINVLYVPTFRKGEKVNLDEIVEKIDTNKYNLIIKLHPLDLKEYDYKTKKGVIYEKKFKTYDLIKIADRVITDYSSLAMEVALLDIPVYFYTYDIEEYKKDPGINFDFENEKIGKYQTTKAKELIELLDEKYDYEILREFKEKYISIDLNNVTKNIAKFIMELMNDEKETKNVGNKSSKKERTI